MSKYTEILYKLEEYKKLEKDVCESAEKVLCTGCLDSQKVHLMQSFDNHYKDLIVITYSEERAKQIYDDFRLFCENVFLFPAKDYIFYQADVRSEALTAGRMKVIQKIIEGAHGVFVMTIDALMNTYTPKSALSNALITLKTKECADISDLTKKLLMMGYRREPLVTEACQFSVRGGIIDIYTLTSENPVRIEFWDDEIDSIRTFDPESQRSVENIDKCLIYPACEMYVDEKRLEDGIKSIKKDCEEACGRLFNSMKTEESYRLKTSVGLITDELENKTIGASCESAIRYFYEEKLSFIDYFEKGKYLICADEPAMISERIDALYAEFSDSMNRRIDKGYMLPKQADILFSPHECAGIIEKSNCLYLSSLGTGSKYFSYDKVYDFHVQNINSYLSNIVLLIDDLKKYKKEKWSVVLLIASSIRAERMAKRLSEYELNAVYYDDPEKAELIGGQIAVVYGSLHKGFCYSDIRFSMISETDVFGIPKKKKKKWNLTGKKLHDYNDLSIGDYVIHENYGLGKYEGIEEVTVDYKQRDYIKISYRDGGKLYVPATNLNLIQKYADAGSKPPKLNRLGTKEWAGTKSRIKKEIEETARDLVLLYAHRQRGSGFRFSEDNVWQKEFEDMFPYEETSDQLAAIEDTKRDMESDKIMDRLICGDVGFGKTEVAIRAAFKAVMDSKQVIFLAPTTILARQHYNTLTERLKKYPVSVGLLCRLRSRKEQNKTVEDIKNGKIDIIVGTHRLLSDDVKYKDAGLLIVDEEQRFGVSHKEKIKKLKENIDVLTLTATPIPRTLHMSMIGVRDISNLDEAPQDRLPIQTYVMEYSEELVREAIHREIARDGQVYYVYNRINDIERIASLISSLVPEAVVAYAHGQMPKNSLENIMIDFVDGNIDVLVSTTIIETGLDIPNVNTIIIHDSDRYGLSQLYQLRGRVGRSNKRSYAFIMYKKGKVLNETASKRLNAIKEFTQLGQGQKIAMRDLSIRGAGNILGERQHGHFDVIGYDLYCKMLSEAISICKGVKKDVPDFETSVDLHIVAYIPSEYISNEYIKLEFYKRISDIESEEELSDIKDELIDRFSGFPHAVDNLLNISYLRFLAHSAYMTEVVLSGETIKFIMFKNAPVSTEKIEPLLAKYKNNLRFTASDKIFFQYNDGKKKLNDDILLKTVKNIIIDIKMLITE